jgi:hypothetical protein
MLTLLNVGHNSNLFTAEVNHNGFFCGLGANLSYVSSTVDYIDLCSSENWSMTVLDEILFMIGCQTENCMRIGVYQRRKYVMV